MASNEMSASLNGGVAGEAAPKLTKKDLRRLGIRSIAEQAGFSFERMQAPGFTWSMLPCFEKLYPDSKKDMSEFMTYNMEFMNTEMHMATFLMGLELSMEERHTDRNLIAGIRNGLFGPLAGLGDAIFWFTVLPISAVRLRRTDLSLALSSILPSGSSWPSRVSGLPKPATTSDPGSSRTSARRPSTLPRLQEYSA